MPKENFIIVKIAEIQKDTETLREETILVFDMRLSANKLDRIVDFVIRTGEAN